LIGFSRAIVIYRPLSGSSIGRVRGKAPRVQAIA
jgi:hypothetical protein